MKKEMEEKKPSKAEIFVNYISKKLTKESPDNIAKIIDKVIFLLGEEGVINYFKPDLVYLTKKTSRDWNENTSTRVSKIILALIVMTKLKDEELIEYQHYLINLDSNIVPKGYKSTLEKLLNKIQDFRQGLIVNKILAELEY